MTYEFYCGLWWNAERIRRTRAVAVLEAIGAAFHKGPLSRAWYDAYASHPSQVANMQSECNLDRVHAQAVGDDQ